MTEQERTDHIDKEIEKFLSSIAEYVDVAQIMVSFQTSERQTMCTKDGFGNWYARIGMAEEFIEQDMARTQYEIKTKEYEGDPE